MRASGADFYFVRFNPVGQVSGTASHQIGVVGDFAFAIAGASDHVFLAGTYTDSVSGYTGTAGLLLSLPSGAPVNGYGSLGTVKDISNANDTVRAVTEFGGSHTLGALDSTFGAAGIHKIATSPGADTGSAIALQADGKPVVVGNEVAANGDETFLLLRISP